MSASVSTHWQKLVELLPFWETVALVHSQIEYLERRKRECGDSMPGINEALAECRATWNSLVNS